MPRKEEIFLSVIAIAIVLLATSLLTLIEFESVGTAKPRK